MFFSIATSKTSENVQVKFSFLFPLVFLWLSMRNQASKKNVY